MKSIAQLNEEAITKYGTGSNVISSFLIYQTRVKVITSCSDFHFWDGETGLVTEIIDNKRIRVLLDTPRMYEGWDKPMETFVFDMEDLLIIENKIGRESLLHYKDNVWIKHKARYFKQVNGKDIPLPERVEILLCEIANIEDEVIRVSVIGLESLQEIKIKDIIEIRPCVNPFE